MKKVNFNLEIGRYLRNLRLEQDLSQGFVASSLGYTSPQFVSNWERGLSHPPAEAMPILARLYKCDLCAMSENIVSLLLRGYEQQLRTQYPVRKKQIRVVA